MEAIRRLKDNIDFLKSMEFDGVNEKAIEDKMQREKDSFRVNGLMEVDDDGRKHQLAYILFFKKYDNPNTHLPDKFRAMLVDQPERQALFVFDDRHPLTAKDAFHLLHGRAVMKAGDYGMQDWYQMDLNKRDSNGDAPVFLFTLEKKDFDVENGLKQYSIKEFQTEDQKTDLLNQLYSGKTVLATVQKDGEESLMLLQPNPKDRTVQVREYEPKAEATPHKQKNIGKSKPWEIPMQQRTHKKKGMSL